MPKPKAAADYIDIAIELAIPRLPALFKRIFKDEAKRKRYRGAAIKLRDLLLKLYPLEPTE